MTTLYLCAAGNPEGVRLALEVNEAKGEWDRIVLLDDDATKQGGEILGVPVIGPFAALATHQPGDVAVNLVARSTKGRDRARERIESFGLPLVSMVHPSVDTRFATIGRSVTIYAGSTISALSNVGDHAVIFTQAVLGHGATLGVGAVLAPGAVINARVRVGDRAYIGSNASVLPDLAVGEDATVSACSATVGDVPDGCTVIGVPAEIVGLPTIAGAKPATIATSHNDTSDSYDAVQAVFAGVLDMPSIARDTNFFDAGGNSKQALDLQLALRQKLGIPVSVVDIFRFPSPGALATHLFGNTEFDHAEDAKRPSRADIRRRRQKAHV
ncbi:phosphopantetheine-binding protein [Alisedimentitalea sp. MJ-SS2]|uniref:phosphopantetheine-binding protein n=1 Tax=Aliisedimentitalea sp. MJ-SS2 TaxID=3049795 RepID=UPI00290DBB47|nr:phosphopantetheine-binding protein [Alisedimentitalea sp. MJ-SS2]MDU8928709.1 phosphopantetheine-binding protein [Alisedimentitalea sp. MJ-SS2]